MVHSPQDALAGRYIKTVLCLRQLDDAFAQTTQPQLRRGLAKVVVAAARLVQHAWHRLVKVHDRGMYDVQLVPTLAPLGLLPSDLEIPIPRCIFEDMVYDTVAGTMPSTIHRETVEFVHKVLAAHRPASIEGQVCSTGGSQSNSERDDAQATTCPNPDTKSNNSKNNNKIELLAAANHLTSGLGNHVLCAVDDWCSLWNRVADGRLGSTQNSIRRGSSIDAEACLCNELELENSSNQPWLPKRVSQCQGDFQGANLLVIQPDANAKTLNDCCWGDDHYVVPGYDSYRPMDGSPQKKQLSAVKRVQSGGKAANRNLIKTDPKAPKPQTQPQMPVVHLLPPLSPARIRQVLTLQGILPLLLPYHHEDNFTSPENPLHIPTTLLLCGPPGVGKTALAHAIANQARATMFDLTYDSILASMPEASTQEDGLGALGTVVRATFDAARRSNSPSVILIENIESIFIRDTLRAASFVADKPAGTQPPCHIRQLLLEETRLLKAEHRVLVIGTSSQPYACVGEDQEALSTYFSDRIVPIGLPNYETRRKMLSSVVASLDWPVDWSDLSLAASASDGLSGKQLLVGFAGYLKDKEWKRFNASPSPPLLHHVLNFVKEVVHNDVVTCLPLAHPTPCLSRPYPRPFDEWIARVVSKTTF